MVINCTQLKGWDYLDVNRAQQTRKEASHRFLSCFSRSEGRFPLDLITELRILSEKEKSGYSVRPVRPKRLYYREPVLICSVLAKRDVFFVDFQLLDVSCENDQLVSSSKFKLVCQVVNAKKPKESRVTHIQLKGFIEFYY